MEMPREPASWFQGTTDVITKFIWTTILTLLLVSSVGPKSLTLAELACD